MRGCRLLPLLTLGLVLALPATPVAGQSTSGGAAQAAADTVPVTRAERLRNQVLERVRERTAPAEADSLSADSAGVAQPREATLTGVEPPTALPFVGTGPRSGEQAPLSLPSGADETMRGLAALPGFTQAVFQGARAEYRSGDRSLVLRGIPGEEEAGTPARFFGSGVRVEADSAIFYDDQAGRVRTVGSTVLTPEQGDPVRSRSLIYDVASERGSATDARTTYAERGGEWIVQADLETVGRGEVYGARARFTSDDRPEPNSYFEASELKVMANRILVARNVRLHFSEVPVLWLPFLAQPLSSGRQSGLLTPQFSVNDVVRTSGGYQRRISNVGFYWAMSDYSDATLAGDWWSGQYSALTGSLRYRWAPQFFQGEFSARQFWREAGSKDLALTTRNNWDPTERSKLFASGNYVSNTGLVRQNSLDPRELTSSINSQAGLQQRFGWGSLSVEARRQQFLTDDRLEMTLPSATLSLSSFTLFRETPARARFYNNVNVNASSAFSRDIRELGGFRPGSGFQFSQADQGRTQGRASASISVGNLSLRTEGSFRETLFRDIPDIFALPMEDRPFVDPTEEGFNPLNRPRLDYSDAEVSWSSSLSFQQRLIGTSSITPSLSLGSQWVRVDSIAEAQQYVEGPTRLSFGVGLQTELYGFFPGFAGFEAVRHKVTPQFSYNYSPAVEPTALQERVFGSRTLGEQRGFSIGFNQTFEARARGEDPATTPSRPTTPATPATRPSTEAPETDAAEEADEELSEGADPASSAPGAPAPGQERRASALDDESYARPTPSRTITLLALSTQALNYDMVQADSTGRWLDGFTTTVLRNSIRSDYLRGLDFSFSHELWDDPTPFPGIPGGEPGGERRFSPHLSQLSVGFSLDGRTRIVQTLAGLFGVSSGVAPASSSATDDDQGGFAEEGFDQNRVLPGLSGQRGGRMIPGMGGAAGGWNARMNYSLRRPRDGVGRAQMLNGTVSFRPTDLLSLSWTTAYDGEAKAFSDHMISVSRDMYDWEATFGFRQAVNGNWTFQFQVSLKANRDLKFDYEQRNLDGGGTPGSLPGFFGGGF